MSGRKAIVAGHICIDITPVFPDKGISDISKVLSPGKLLQMEGVNIHTGGAVANTGLAMKILGADVSLMGKTGQDEFGGLIISELEKYGAADKMIRTENERTSYSVVLAVPGIDRIFLHDPGANDTFSYDDLDFDEISKADLFHFGYPPIMKRMYRNNGEELVKIFKKIHESGTATSLDLAAVDPSSEAGQADWKGILEKVLPYVDFFVPSAEELCFMADREMYENWSVKACGRDLTEVISIQDVKKLGKWATDSGAGSVLIKCGAPGMYYRTSSGDRMKTLCEKTGLSESEWSDKEGFERSFVHGKVVSGTGAGDTSIAAFLTSVLNGESLETALQMATATGACCVMAYDALSGLKPLDELKEKIRKGWQKVSV
jgi:sugar/nucleoside kinase (ribokinase family)